MNPKFDIPTEITTITKTLENKGYLAYLVGGCVRDLMIGREPKDWDITTNAKPEEIISLFDKTIYENRFGTVTIVNKETNKESLGQVEVTPFRTEATYSDKRHPDEVTFSDKLEDDLKRRDFTINALSYREKDNSIVDLYDGIKDIKDKTIRAVGQPAERISEDPLRILRAIRLSVELGFMINRDLKQAIKENVHLLKDISVERIRNEVSRITESAQPKDGYLLMAETGVLKQIMPELSAAIGVGQNKNHIYDVWEHSLRAMQHAANRNWPLVIRLAALFHDIGKPKTKRRDNEKGDYTFYGHEVVSARLTEKILTRLKFPTKETMLIVKLVRNHMFFSDIEQITLSAVRRIISKVGPEAVWDLMKVRACDRIGMGRPKENPYRLRKYESMIDEALRDPTSVGMLKIDGNDLIKLLNVKPGPKIGFILHALLDEVLTDPTKNKAEYLQAKAEELAKLTNDELKELGESGKQEKNKKEAEELAKIRKKHGVR
ncbi:MAG: CCA tRNA nucleotidyltransferase [Candidatus Paceibacterota bacterium]